MYFSIKTKKQHPQARLISEALWAEIFKSDSIPDLIIPWMSMPYEELKKELTPMSAKKKEKAWIAIACSHPEMENQELIEIGEKLGLNASEMLNLAVMLGDSPKHLVLLESLFRQETYSNWFFKHSSLRMQRAIQCRHLNTLKYLIGTVNSFENFFRGIIESFTNVHLSLKDYLMGIIQSMIPSSRLYYVIAEGDFAVFRSAAKYGNIDFLKYQVKQVSGKLQDMIAAENFGAFRDAAKNGHLGVLTYLEEKAPDMLPDMITAGNFYAFEWAASNGHLHVLKYLEEKASDKLQDMIEADHFYAFQWAVMHDHLNVVKYLVEKTPERVHDMIAVDDFNAFEWAVSYGHHSMVHYLLNNPTVFAHAETSQNGFFDRYIELFVVQKMTALRTQQQQAKTDNMDIIFDVIDPNEAKLLFYIARNLIRRNDQRLSDDLCFLLDIPAVKALAHTELTPDQSNELLRLALFVDNQQATTILLNIPEIRFLAEQDGLDLPVLAADRKFPIVPLTQDDEPQNPIDFYDELIRSIPAEEREDILAELDSRSIINRAELLCKELSTNKRVGSNLEESRTLFLAALRNLKEKKISVNQLATLHILDSAIRTLYVNPMVYFIHKYVDDDQELSRTYNLFALASIKGLPTSVKRYNYDTLVLPQAGFPVSDLPERMQKPLMRRFFNFNDSEWDEFCKEMVKAPSSEQFFHVLVAPEEGCWSSIVSRIQKVLKCMRVLDWVMATKEGFEIENIMPVPSFSMLQAAINAKAHTLGRTPVQLLPTYGYVEAAHYAELKSFGKIAMAMYLPESRFYERYRNDTGRFRTSIDGHPSETAFAGAIHDVYHALRELAMTESVAKARIRLAFIAKQHPKNKINPERSGVDDILIDGELIYSYPPERETIFDLEYRPTRAQVFGDLFYETSLKFALHDDLKHAFIEDMVIHQEEWQKLYHLGRSDLRENDQKIFDEIKAQQLKSAENNRTITDNVMVQVMNKIGFLGTNIQKIADLESLPNNLSMPH
ncbi:ankyrin repeat domain-containing protein [Legionella sainthelensi]|uniref:ankyrin repeat domain-containing protein n=1 Tax=Legionella sainthelensi TaxID=28087 RepID=UPI000E1FF5EE|nr:ankyrin repeat domain-containing protein [Legionella sainthelensi]